MRLHDFINDESRARKLAKLCNTKPIYLLHIALGHSRPSTKLAIAIDRYSAQIGPCRVTKESLRPDVWLVSDKAQAKAA